LKQYRIDIKPTAEADIITRYQKIAEDAPQNALSWYLKIIESIEKLDTMAERCPIAPEDQEIQKSIRHLIIGDYRVLFYVNGDTVEVLHVRHGSMDRKL